MSLFCLVHGACQGAWCWELLIPHLEGRGHKTVAMELFFHDCQPDVARWAVSKIRNHQSMAHIFEVNPLQALPDVECAYIVCTNDHNSHARNPAMCN